TQNPGQRQVVEIMPTALSVRPILAESSQRAINDTRIHFCNRVVINPKPIDYARPELRQHTIGLLGKFQEDVSTWRPLQVDRYRLLVAIDLRKRRALAVNHRRTSACR